MHQARLETESTLAAFCRSHDKALLNHRFAVVLERQQRDRRRLNMRAQRHSVNDAVSRVPPSVNTCAIQKHLDAQMDSFLRRLGAIADRELLDGDDAEGCGDDPACGARNPGPAVLVGIEANVAISCFEFPSPEPVPLSAGRGMGFVDCAEDSWGQRDRFCMISEMTAWDTRKLVFRS
jgi:hypothetical protein